MIFLVVFQVQVVVKAGSLAARLDRELPARWSDLLVHGQLEILVAGLQCEVRAWLNVRHHKQSVSPSELSQPGVENI